MAPTVDTRKPRKDRRGERTTVTLRVPNEIKEIYEARAAALGIPIGSWCILAISDKEGLPVPNFVFDDLEQARRLRTRSQEELPLRIA